MSDVSVFDKTEQKTMHWMNGIATSMGSTDKQRSYTILRAVLHATRDRLIPDEAVHLGAQLPMLVRGFYYEGWHPRDKPKRYRHKSEFLAEVKKNVPDLDNVQLERAITAVFETLESAMVDIRSFCVRHALPAELRELWPISGM
ncbi:MAG: DUF2267 domain-containing protein [Gammaproteobacteria bacterium]|nr:DUF2267 domain-containing protein [Gammaproteobacteria bacterium]